MWVLGSEERHVRFLARTAGNWRAKSPELQVTKRVALLKTRHTLSAVGSSFSGR